MMKRHAAFPGILGVITAVWLGSGILAWSVGTSGDLIDKPDLISVDFRDADVRDVLRSIADLTDVNIVSAPGVKGSITISLKEVTLRDALTAILTVNHFTYRQQGHILFVESVPVLTTAFMQLRYSDAVDLREILDALRSENGSILVDSRSNKLVVRDFPERIQEMERVIRELDHPTPQVTINAKIIDILVSDALKLGINFSGSFNDGDPSGTMNTRATGFALNEGELGFGRDNTRDRGTNHSAGMRLTDSIGSTGAFGQPTNQNTTFNMGFNDARVDSRTLTEVTAAGVMTSVVSANIMDMMNLQLDALIEKGRSMLLAAPTISTLNNETASIIIGEKVGIKEQTQTTTGTTETTRFQDVGTKLEVTPQINVDGYITMTIRPEISSVNIFSSDEIRFNTREARTKVRVKDRQTVIIGGLILNNDNLGERRVPYLSRIPVLGLPFRGRSDSGSQRELVVFLTPTLFGEGIPKSEARPHPAHHELVYPEKPEQEAKAKETELVDRFYESRWVNKPATDIAEGNTLARHLYQDGELLYRKARRVTGRERQERIFKMALERLQTLNATYPESDDAPRAMYLAALIQFNYLDNPESALLNFETLMERYPEHSLYRKAAKGKNRVERKMRRHAAD